MVRQTPRFDLDTYERGDLDWDHTDTVEALDKHAIARGPLAERPETGVYNDALFYATDQSVLWGWDESAEEWTIRAGLGVKNERLPQLMTEWLNSVRYISPGDDVPGIFQSLDNGDGVHFNPGKHSVDTPVSLTTANVTITGSEGAKLIPDSPMDRVLHLNAQGHHLEGLHIDGLDRCREGVRQSEPGHLVNVTVENIVEPSSHAGTTSGIVSFAGGASRIINCTVRRVRSPHTSVGRGIRLPGAGPHWITDCRVTDVEPPNDADGIVTEGSDGEETIIRGCLIENIAEGGVKINNADATCLLEGNVLKNTDKEQTFAPVRVQEDDARIEGNEIYWRDPSRGIHIAGDNVSIVGNTIDVTAEQYDNTADGVRINGDYSSINIVDNDITGAGRYGIYVDAPSGVIDFTARGNCITDVANQGINLSAPETGRHERVILGENKCWGADEWGVYVDTVDSISVVGNVLRSGFTELRIENATNVERAANVGDFSDGT